MVEIAAKVRNRLKELGYGVSLINGRFIKPLDEDMLQKAAQEHELIVTLEENVRGGGFGDHVLEYLNDIGARVPVMNIALPDDYIEHGNVDILRQETGIDVETIVKKIIVARIGHGEEEA